MYINGTSGTAKFNETKTMQFLVGSSYDAAVDVSGFTCAVTAPVTSCGSITPTYLDLAPNTAEIVTVTYTTSATTGTGTVSLSGHFTPGGAQTGFGNVEVSNPPGLLVVPVPPTVSVPANQTGLVASFQITNPYAGSVDLWSPSCTQSGAVASCGTFSPTSATLAAGQTITMTVGYASGVAGAGSVALSVWHGATGEGNKQSSGSLPVTVTGPITHLTIVPVPPEAWVEPNQPALSATFSITNPFSQSVEVWAPSCTRTGAVTSCAGFTPDYINLGAGQTAVMSVGYASGNAGSGSVSLSVWHNVPGSGNNQTSATLPVTVAAAVTTPVIARRNRTKQLDRSLCLTTGAGEAAVQCGDLIYTHAMPAYRTLGRDRNLTLFYNSATAKPRPVVAVAVSPGASAPTSIRAELAVQKTAGGPEELVASATYPGWANQSRQIVMSFDAGALSTGVYSFTLSVVSVFPAGTSLPAVLKDTILVVNRTASRFGRGWSLAGVEWIQHFGPEAWPNQRTLWVGGDGSARIYTPVAGASPAKWVGPKGAYRDTITYDGSKYVRQLRYGVEVHYDNLGRHTATVSRARQVTTFSWGGGDSLLAISVPPAGTGGSYTVAYASGKVDSIGDPTRRGLDLAVNIAGDLVTLRDPDGVSMSFTYPNGVMGTLTNRLGYTTHFTYTTAPAGWRVLAAAVPYGSIGNLTATTAYQPWDTLGSSAPAVPVAVDTSVVMPRCLVPGRA